MTARKELTPAIVAGHALDVLGDWLPGYLFRNIRDEGQDRVSLQHPIAELDEPHIVVCYRDVDTFEERRYVLSLSVTELAE